MRCYKVQERIEEAGEAGLTGAAQRHFKVCASCQAHGRDFSTMAAGLRLLAQEAGPVPSWGFTASVLRRLGEIPTPGLATPEFFESVGRRVVLATLLLVLTIFLVMILPATGPLRQSTQLDLYWPRVQAASAPFAVEDFPPVPAVVGVSTREAAFYR